MLRGAAAAERIRSQRGVTAEQPGTIDRLIERPEADDHPLARRR